MKFLEAVDSICVERDGEQSCEEYALDGVVSFFLFNEGSIVWTYADMDDEVYGHSGLMDAIKVHYSDGSDLSPYDDIFRDRLNFEGQISSETEEILKSLRTTYYGSFPTLNAGRLWPDEPIKAISFYHMVPPHLRHIVVNFVKKFGNPEDFIFELRGSQYTYQEFMQSIPKEVKSYLIKNKKYTLDDLTILRQDMHTKGGLESERAARTLCNLLTNDVIGMHPELRGFKPPSCDGMGDDHKYYAQYRNLERSQLQQRFRNSLVPKSKWGNVTLNPEDMAGIERGSGFRQRTQKELDRAWDKLGFKEWLQNNC